MEAVILAGGLGSRLRPLTLTRPKALLPVGNVPLVARLVEHLPPEVRRVVVATSYRKDALARYFETTDFEREIVVVDEPEPLGTAGAVKNAMRDVAAPFFVLHADTVTSLDFRRLKAYHEEQEAAATVALHRVRDPRAFGIAALATPEEPLEGSTTSGDRQLGPLARFVEKPERREDAPSNLAYTGAAILEPDALDFVDAGTSMSLERDVFPRLLSEGRPVQGYLFEGYWLDAGSPETYLKANEATLKDAGRSAILGAGVQDEGGRIVDWGVVGDRCRLGSGCEIERSVLLPRVRIGREVAVKASILGEGVIVEDEVSIVDAVVGDGAVIRSGVLLKNIKVEPGAVIGDAHG